MQPPFSPQELAEAAAYHRAGYWLSAAKNGIDVAVIAIWLAFFVRRSYRWAERWAVRVSTACQGSPTAQRIDRALRSLWKGPGWGTALLFSTLNYLYLVSAFVPIGIYFGYFHAHAYGMSTQSAGSFIAETLNVHLRQLAGHLAVTLGLLSLARRYSRWWLVIGGVGGVALVLLSVVEPFQGTDRIPHPPLAQGPLRERLLAVAAQAHVQVREIEVKQTSMQSVAVDAYFTGKGPTRTIVLSDTLVQGFTQAEVAAVVAHEAGHISESRWLSTACLTPALVLFLWAVDRILRIAVRRHWLGATEPGDVRLLPWLTVAMYAVMTLGSPISAAWSRQRELAADAFGARLTGDVWAFEEMLIHVARVNKMDPTPPTWIIWKGAYHPPLMQRLEALEALR